MKIPSGYTKIIIDKTIIIVKDKFKNFIIENKLFDGKAIFEKSEINQHYKGRGNLFLLSWKGSGKDRILVRHYFRGGVIRKFNKDIYFGSLPRPVAELAITEKARNWGIPTSETLAVYIHKIIGNFYRGDILSKEIPFSINLIEYLKKNSGKNKNLSKKIMIIKLLAELIKKMHNRNIYHGDLNLKNVLIQKLSNQIPEIYIIDFDKSKILKNLEYKHKLKELFRLNRSAEKFQKLEKITLTRQDRIRFLKVYFKEIIDLKPFLRNLTLEYNIHRRLNQIWRIFSS
jgi:tRNA A-37 threonylcarbamoyl transferase component Bud32